MTRYVDERSARVLSVRTGSSAGSSETYQDAVVFQHYLDKPATIRRKKPLDLFGSSTGRIVSSAKWATVCPSVRSHTSNTDPFYTQTVYLWPSYPSSFLDAGITGGVDFGQLGNRMLAQIKDQKVNLSVSVAELGKTTDMVFGLARDVWTTFHRLRSGRAFADFVRDLQNPTTRASRKLAKRWLEYTYGWKPAMSDIYGLSDQLHKELSLGKAIYVGVREPIRLSEDYWYGTPKGNRVIKLYTGVKRMRGRYVVDNQGLKSLTEYGITNPSAVLYELMPYSFVIDWVIDISSYLSVLDAMVGVKNFRYIRSYGYDSTMRFENHQRIFNPSWDQVGVGVSVGKQTVRSRSAILTTLTPRLPTYDPHIGVTRMISACAIIRNLKG